MNTNSKLDLTYYIELQRRLEEIFLYVDCNRDNFNTFSVKIENLFVDTCAFFDSLSQTHIIEEKNKNVVFIAERSNAININNRIQNNNFLNMGDYKILFEQEYQLSNKTLNLNHSDSAYFGNPIAYFFSYWSSGKQPLNGEEIKPFESWSNNNSTTWWKSYTALKHNRLANFKKATLEGLIEALGAVFILLTVRHEKLFKNGELGQEYYRIFFPNYYSYKSSISVGTIGWQ